MEYFSARAGGDGKSAVPILLSSADPRRRDCSPVGTNGMKVAEDR